METVKTVASGENFVLVGATKRCLEKKIKILHAWKKILPDTISGNTKINAVSLHTGEAIYIPEDEEIITLK